MFERYTESARRTIFFGRYEASQFGSPEIDTEHLLLGLLREEKSVPRWVPKLQPQIVRQRIESVTEKLPPTSTAVDLPPEHCDGTACQPGRKPPLSFPPHLRYLGMVIS